MTNQKNDPDKIGINLPPSYKPENKFWVLVNNYRYISIPVTIVVLGLLIWGISSLIGVISPTPSAPPASPPVNSNPGEVIDHPSISKINVSEVTDSSATISWVTSIPANGAVDFWITDPDSKMTLSDNNFGIAHNIVLNNLSPDTTYNITVRSDTPSGFEATSDIAKAFTTSAKPTQTGPEVGYLAPDFTLQDINDKTVNLSDFKGKWLMLVFWDMDCDACRSSMTPLQMYYKTIPRDKIDMASVNVKEKDKLILVSLLKARAITYPVLLDTYGQVAESYKVNVFPTTFFIDSGGVIRKVADRRFNNMEDVEELVNSVIGN